MLKTLEHFIQNLTTEDSEKVPSRTFIQEARLLNHSKHLSVVALDSHSNIVHNANKEPSKISRIAVRWRRGMLYGP